jgi:hypothetical protein
MLQLKAINKAIIIAILKTIRDTNFNNFLIFFFLRERN